MGLLSGPVSVTRYTVTSRPAELAFDQAAFRELQPGGEVRERAGFLPFEPDAPYRVGHQRWAFRVRLDTVRPDPTGVAERLKQLLKTEREQTGKPYVPARTRRRLRQLAEEELVVKAAPRSRVVECVLDSSVLLVGSTTTAMLSTTLALLASIGVTVMPKTPWLDRGDEEVDSTLVEPRGPGQSVLGCRFLKVVLGDAEVVLEPESGSVRLVTPDAKVALRGTVLPELQRYLKGEVELLSARLVVDDMPFSLDGLSFRVSSLRIETERHDAWTEQLDARMEKIVALHDVLDGAYARFAPAIHALPA